MLGSSCVRDQTSFSWNFLFAGGFIWGSTSRSSSEGVHVNQGYLVAITLPVKAPVCWNKFNMDYLMLFFWDTSDDVSVFLCRLNIEGQNNQSTGKWDHFGDIFDDILAGPHMFKGQLEDCYSLAQREEKWASVTRLEVHQRKPNSTKPGKQGERVNGCLYL